MLSSNSVRSLRRKAFSTRVTRWQAVAGGLASLLMMAGCNRQASSGTSQGFVFSDFADGSRKDFDICWDASSSWLPADTRANIEAKVLDQYNGRTAVTFRFLGAPCAAVRGLEIRILTQESPGGTTCPSMAAATAHPFLRQAVAGSTGDPKGPGSDLVLCRQALKVAGTPGQASFEKTIAAVMLHELGHVLGLAHEQQRADVVTDDPACWARMKNHIIETNAEYAKLGIKTRALGAYDARSIMNYCNAAESTWKTWRDVELSAGDVATLAAVFGAPSPRNVGARDSSSTTSQPAASLPSPEPTPMATPFSEGAPSDAGFGAEPTPNPADVLVHCDLLLLRRCIEQFGGGAGCLDTNRTQRECVSIPSPSRTALPADATKACIRSRASVQEKAACLPSP